MRRHTQTLIACLAVTLAASGCATVTRGAHEAFVVETDPPGATVQIDAGDGTRSCTSPCSVKVNRRGPLHVEIDRPGCERIETTVTSQITAGGAVGMAGNVILGGLIGAAIDGATGAMSAHKPNPLHVNLVCTKPERTADLGGGK